MPDKELIDYPARSAEVALDRTDWCTDTSHVMVRRAMQHQKTFSLLEFQRLHGTEELFKAALEKVRWPVGFRPPRYGGNERGLVYGRRLKRYRRGICRQVEQSPVSEPIAVHSRI